MSIVPMQKVTLYGAAEQQDVVLDGLQRLGCLHLVPLRAGNGHAGELSASAYAALKYLEACPDQEPQETRRNSFDFARVDAEALAIQHEQHALSDEQDELTAAIAQLRPFGDFQLPESATLGGLRFWFYKLPHHEKKRLAESDLTWQIAGSDLQFLYVVVLSEEAPTELGHKPLVLDPRPLSDLERRLWKVKERLRELHWQRVQLTRWCTLLRRDLAEAEDRAQRESAAEQTHADAAVFAVQGWAPRAAVDDVRRYAEQNGLALTVADPVSEEAPPTLLKNPERVAGGEGAVTFYITPGYATWDPTTIVFFSFCLFFAMIFSDAGYALLLGGVVAAFWRKFETSATGIRFRNLLLGLVAAAAVYGVLVGSYFGVTPAPGSLLGSLKILDIQDQGSMMALAVAIGGVHLMLANTITAWRYRRTSRCLGALGWTIMIAGGLVYGVSMMDTPQPERWQWMGQGLVIAGAVSVFCFSSARPLFSTKLGDWFGRLFDGCMALTGVSKIFGDTLSYLRLFALGLASAQLASTFNGLAATTADSIAGVGILLAGLILLLGHGINFLLAVMSGVVHGLRLNCIEFFNWSLTEEGYPFQAFCKKAER